MSQTQTVSYLKKNAADLSLDEPMIITQHGVPKYVIESFEDKQRRDEAIALMKLISISKQSSQDGVLSFEEMEKLISEA